jgi:hypothetical protein
MRKSRKKTNSCLFVCAILSGKPVISIWISRYLDSKKEKPCMSLQPFVFLIFPLQQKMRHEVFLLCLLSWFSHLQQKIRYKVSFFVCLLDFLIYNKKLDTRFSFFLCFLDFLIYNKKWDTRFSFIVCFLDFLTYNKKLDTRFSFFVCFLDFLITIKNETWGFPSSLTISYLFVDEFSEVRQLHINLCIHEPQCYSSLCLHSNLWLLWIKKKK